MENNRRERPMRLVIPKKNWIFSLGNALYWSMTGRETPGSCRRPPTPFFTRTAQEKLQLIRAYTRWAAFLSRRVNCARALHFYEYWPAVIVTESFSPSFSLSRTAHLLTNLRLLLAVRQVGAWCMGNKAAGVVFGANRIDEDSSRGRDKHAAVSMPRVCVCCIATHSSAAVRSLLTPHTLLTSAQLMFRLHTTILGE